jgi:integrase
MESLYMQTREPTSEALRFFHKAIELDSDFAVAYSMAAFCYLQRKAGGWVTERAQEITEAARLARRAVELGKDDAVALSRAGHTLAYVAEDFDAGALFIDRAVVLNPNLASAWYASGWLKVWIGEPETAIKHLERFMRIFTYAVRHRMRPDNPVRGVMRFADGKRERRLTDDEYKSLGDALVKARIKNFWPAAVAAARFLALTGWRSGEALGLRWDEVDLPRRTATLDDTKTGRSVRPLPRAACDVLRDVPRSGALVFPATRGEGLMLGFRKLWKRIAKLGGLPPDVTPHVLRHSFTSLGSDLGYSEMTIAALVGHKGHSMTSRYIHSADAVLLAAADAIADQTAGLMSMEKGTVEVIAFRRESA